MRLPKPPLHRFKLRPKPNSRLYFNVYIFKTRKLLHEFIKYTTRNRANPRCEAMTHGYTIIDFKGGKQKTQEVVGDIYFWQQKLGSSVISHESTHAALRYLARKKVKQLEIHDDSPWNDGLASPQEEDLCYLVGAIMGNIVHELNEKDLFLKHNKV